MEDGNGMEGSEEGCDIAQSLQMSGCVIYGPIRSRLGPRRRGFITARELIKRINRNYLLRADICTNNNLHQESITGNQQRMFHRVLW